MDDGENKLTRKWTESLKERAVIKRECYDGATALNNGI